MSYDLTARERDLLARSAALVLAGEWPWEPEQTGEREALERAAQKLQALTTYVLSKFPCEHGGCVDRVSCAARGQCAPSRKSISDRRSVEEQ